MKCLGDRIVWVNTNSGIYHYQGERYFGSTQHGEFLCEHEANAKETEPLETVNKRARCDGPVRRG